MAFLKRASGGSPGQIIELKQDRTVIGRSPEHCHVVLDPNGVSRRHAEIYKKGDEYYLSDLNSRNMTKVNNAKLLPGIEHRLAVGDRINICDVEFLFYLKIPTESDSREVADIVIVPDADIADVPHLHTLDASRSSAMASMVKPELKLKAILEITRNLSTELKIDKVAPRILDSLMELFPQAERLFLILVDPDTQRLVRKAFRCRPGRRASFTSTVPADEAQLSISRSIVNHVLVQKKAVLSQDASMDKNLPTSASIADLKIRSVMCVPLLDTRQPGPGNPSARHQRSQAVPPGRPGRADRGGEPGGHRHPERHAARITPGTRTARSRPEAGRTGAEAVPAARRSRR